MRLAPIKMETAVAVLLPLLAGAAGLTLVSDPDSWTHLALGRAMWEQGTLAPPEPFLGYAQGSPLASVAPHHALFGLLLYGVHSVAGPAGLSLLVALLAATSFALLWRLRPGRGGGELPPTHAAVSFLFLLLVLALARERFLPRPEMLATPLAALALGLAWRWRERPSPRTLAALAGTLLLWAGVHVSWTAGLGLCAVPLLLWPAPPWWRELAARRAGRWALAALGTAALAGGIAALRFAAMVARDLAGGKGMASLSEMRPLWEHPALLLPFLAAAGTGLLLSWGGREGRGRRLAAALLFLLPALLVSRNLALSLLALAFPALEGAGGLRLPRPPFPRAAGAAVALGTAALAVLLATDGQRPLGAGVRWELFPREAAAFVKRERLPATVMNSMEVGGFLDWAWGGDPPTFIDGRNLGDNRVWADTLEMMEARGLPRLLERHGVRTILLRTHYHNSGRLFPLLHWLQISPRWTLVHASDALVYALDPPPQLPSLSKREGWRFALREARSRIADGGDGAHLRWTVGVCLLQLGETERARAAFAAARRDHPELVPAYRDTLAPLSILEDPAKSLSRGAKGKDSV